MAIERATASDPVMQAGANALYAASPETFVADCVWVYEPRNANKKEPTRIPAVLFPRQREFIQWMHERFESKSSAPVEKSRDSGATWMAAAFAVWMWLYHPGSIVGFGSRKEIYVDQKGDLNSIFEKIRSIIRNLPPYVRPKSLNEKVHFNFCRLLNPENEASIVGEAGDNIGRGGRTSIYFIDESAFVERPQMIEASLSATTDVRIDISTPQAGSLFNVWTSTSPIKFIFDVHDAPWHTPEWLKAKREDMEMKGLGHLFRQEFLRDPTAGIAGQLIPGDWVEAAIGAAAKLGITPSGARIAALDVADGGADRSSLAMRHGISVFYCKSRNDVLADGAGLWAYFESLENNIEQLRYDSIGVGAGAAASLRDKRNVKVIGWSASGEVIYPNARFGDEDSKRTNADMFENAKSQAWWSVRDRFMKTYQRLVLGKMDVKPDDMISLEGSVQELRELKTELSQVTYKHNNAGKVVINKAPDGHASPNRADSLVIAFAPVKTFEIYGVI